MKMTLVKLLHWLKVYSSAPQIQTFKRFRDGAIYFAVGLITIYLANVSMTPSAKQEFIVLLGLCLTSLGFIMAMVAQIKLIVSRIFHFFFNDH